MYGVFLRKDLKIWQFIAGGGEDYDKSIYEAARREAYEEAGISENAKYIKLTSRTTIPVVNVTGKFTWGKDIFVVPEYSFGVDAQNEEIKLSHEHEKMQWLRYEEAVKLLKYDSNKSALWELDFKLRKNENKNEINNIKTPEDILKFMDNIRYGWLDINGEEHIGNMKNFRRLYRTASLEEILNLKIGICIEQVYLMKILLDKINIKSKMFCTRIYEGNDFNNLDEDEHMHCFVLYYLNGKVYQLEHPNLERIGIYTFNNEEEAIRTINKYYINLSGKKARPVTEFFEVKPNLTFKEFNNYINSLDNKEE